MCLVQEHSFLDLGSFFLRVFLSIKVGILEASYFSRPRSLMQNIILFVFNLVKKGHNISHLKSKILGCVVIPKFLHLSPKTRLLDLEASQLAQHRSRLSSNILQEDVAKELQTQPPPPQQHVSRQQGRQGSVEDIERTDQLSDKHLVCHKNRNFKQ